MTDFIKKYIAFVFGILALLPMACEDDIDPVVEELETERTFAPVGLEVLIRNQVIAELDWTAEASVDTFKVEFSTDNFATILSKRSILGEQLPLQETLDGETAYQARVKAVSIGNEDSKWSVIEFETHPEQIFLPLPGENVEGDVATLVWEAGSEVTHFFITPGNLLREISAAEAAAGQATIEGLSGATDYIVTLYNGDKRRGTAEFQTLKEANVFPLDDLSAVIDAAADGDVLVLAAGDYFLGGKEITKSITIEGQKWYDMPVVEGQLTCESAVSNITVRYIDFRGNGNYGQFFNAAAGTCNLDELIIDGCEISGYDNNVIYNNSSGATYGDILITNSYIHDIEGGGGDGFDFRQGNVGSLTIENSTFANGIRSFLRMQVAATVAVRNCTMYKVCIVASSNNRGFFRMSGPGNSLEVSNCLFVETGVNDNGTNRGYFSNAGDIDGAVSTSFGNNYYYNNIGLWEGEFTDPAAVGATEGNPEFADPANGDFTVTNQDIIDANVGDTNWFQ